MNHLYSCLALIVVSVLPQMAYGGEIRDVTKFGAKMNGSSDDTAAIRSAIAQADPGDVIYFPPGRAILTGKIAVDKTLTLRGETPARSILEWRTTNGGISFTLEQSESCEVSNMTLVAGQGNAGTALEITSVDRNSRAALIEDICIEKGNGPKWWNTSLHLNSASLSVIRNVEMIGNYAKTYAHVYHTGKTFAPQLSGLTLRNSQYGIRWEGVGEGLYLHNSLITNCDYGFSKPANQEPFFDIMNCQITAKVRCLEFANLRNTSIASNVLVMQGGGSNACVEFRGNGGLQVNFLDNVLRNTGSSTGPAILIRNNLRLYNFIDNELLGFNTGYDIRNDSFLINIGDKANDSSTKYKIATGVARRNTFIR